MLELTKRPHTKRDIKIIANNEEVKFPKMTKNAIEVLINSLIDQSLEDKNSSPEDVFGEDWLDKRKKIGHMIRGARTREGITQIELADKLGLNQPNLSAIENGERAIPKGLIQKIAKILHVDIKILK